MSNKKISKRRQEELLKQQKQRKRTLVLVIALVVAACAGGIGWMVYDSAQQREAEAKKQAELELSRKETNSSTVNVDPILEYLSGLDTDLLNDEIAPTDYAASGEAVSPESVSGQ